MKKITSVICMLLALVVMICSMPMAGAVSSSAPYTYENSFLVTAEAKGYYRAYTAKQWAALLNVETCYILGREAMRYQLIAMNGDVPVEQDIERVKAIDGVVYAGRNKYAQGYAEKESSITLSQNELEIPLGGTATLDVAQTNILYGMRQFHPAGIKIEVYTMGIGVSPGISYDELCSELAPFIETENFNLYALYEDDDFVEEWETFLTLNLSSAHKEQRKCESPIGQYFIDCNYKYDKDYLGMVELLSQLADVATVRIVYDQKIGLPAPTENWSVGDESIVTLTTQKATGGFYGAPHTAVLQGNQVGQTVVQVEYGYGDILCYATCVVNVVEKLPETPTDIPETPTDIPETPTDIPETPTDVMGKDLGNEVTEIYTGTSYIYKYTAVSALHILRAAVGKEEGSINRKYDVNADGEINAVDALWALQSAVGKRVVEWPLDKAFPE